MSETKEWFSGWGVADPFRRVGRAQTILLAFVAALFTASGHARAADPPGDARKLFVTAPYVTVIFGKEPCNAGPWLEKWRTATLLYDGRQFAACWKAHAPGDADELVVLDSAGDVTYWSPFDLQLGEPPVPPAVPKSWEDA